MVAIDEQCTAASARTVHGQRNANREPTGTILQRAAVFRFDDEMEVILLYREVEDSKARIAGAGDRGARTFAKIRAERRFGAFVARIVI